MNDGSQLSLAWGFGVNTVSEDVGTVLVHEFFKTRLQSDGADTSSHGERPSTKELIEDYLRCLHDCVRSSFPQSLFEGEWDKTKICFVFSFPAIWTPDTIRVFKGLAASAGFATPDGNHFVEARLTESAAAAIHTVNAGINEFKVSRWHLVHRPHNSHGVTRLTLLQVGDSILMVDTGGGTTVSTVLPHPSMSSSKSSNEKLPGSQLG